ncbi:MAG: MFS transporter [Candidatus Eremiobacteraeota bacterium]|nr:MFS transporter [Candidatus Eremiobacteraeota bacterium]MBC5827456.1 MFS transporter [Candidatus Eremiobacteraeota bacterium]
MTVMVRILPILGVTFIDILGFSILIPILPYFVKSFGASDMTVGLLFSTFAACQIVAGPVWGRLSDRTGRKQVLIISQVGATVGWTMLAFAHSIGAIFFARIVEGISGGNISVTQAYVADLVEPAQRSRAFAYVGAAFSSGIVFGPAIGGILLARFGYSAPFLAAAALQLFTLGITIFMLPESRSGPSDIEATKLRAVIKSLRNERVAPILWQQWMYSLALYAWFGVFSLLLKVALRLTVSQASYFFAAFGLFSAALQVGVVDRVASAFGDRRCSTIGIAISVLGFLLVPLGHSVWTLVPAFICFGAGMALSRPTITSLLTGAAPEQQRGTILGVGSSLDNVSGVLMPPLSTGVLGRYGSSWAATPSFVFATIALLMGLAAQRRESHASVAHVAEAAPPA